MTKPAGVARQEAKKVSDAQSFDSLGSNAASMVADAACCILVGLFDAARRLLTKAEQWLSLAAASHEIPQHNYFPHGTEALRHADWALCRWLSRGDHDADNLWRAVEENTAFYKTAVRDIVSVDLTAPYYLDAGAYAEVVAHCEGARRFKPPADPRKAHRSAHICYVLAKHRLGAAYQDVNPSELLTQFCNRYVGAMLAESQFDDVACWMKIAHWRPGLDPFATVLKAYDYLPDVTPPREVIAYRAAHPSRR